MEELYSNLDNYEDVHALEELRAENKELKEKLAENSTAMAKLQKDYDNLEMAFKTLENNYSSLLKTARAELVRKTQRITQLNTEKDLMVLDAFKSGKNIRRNFNTGVKNPGRLNLDRPWNGSKKTKGDDAMQKNVAMKQERRESPILLKKDADPRSGTFNRNKPDNTGVKVELSNRRKSNVIDNIAQHKTEHYGPPKTTARSIKDRRKSTPAVSMPIDTYSSCDEQEREYPTKETRTDYEMRNINKQPIDSKQTSGTSSLDDRGHKHYEFSSRGSYKSRSTRYHDKSSYRAWDKEEVSFKYRKQHSPERGQKRPFREHPGGYPKQHREHLDDHPKQQRERLDDMQSRDHKDDYPRQSKEYKNDYPKQHREHPDDHPKQHRERLDDMQSRDHKDDYPRQSKEYKNDYPKQHREHPDDHPKQHRERLDDMQSRDHKDDYPRQSKEYKNDNPKQHREHPDDHPKQHRERLDDMQSRDHKDDYPRQSREYKNDYLKQHGERLDDAQSREYKDDYTRQESVRFQGRSLESPPPESYSRHQLTKSTHQPDYDRYPHEQQKNRYNHDDKYYSKDSDEPLIKRQRRLSHGNSDTQSLDERRPYRETEVDAQPTPNFTPQELDMLRFSCQSPDYVHTEEAIANHPIKEIMATAATPLDDPRVTSKRYVIQNENGKETLSTVVGRHADEIQVKQYVWNLNKIKAVGIPAALVRRPSDCSDLLVKDIYMDIDNPPTNLDESMESGELRETGDEIHEVRGKLKEIQHNTQDFKISQQPPEQISKPEPVNTESVSKPNIAKYRIPKIGESNKNTYSNMDVPIIDLDENVPHHRNFNINNKDAGGDSVPKGLLPPRQQYNNKRDDFVADSKNNSKIVERKKSKSRERSDSQYQSTLTKIAIVADDLELSDDTSDNMDSNKRVVPEKVLKHCKKPLQMNEASSIDSLNSVENETVASSHITEIKSTVNTAGITDDEKAKETDSTKKQKTKKKKSKDIFKESVDGTANPDHVLEKKSKSKKEKESTPKETKEKFSKEIFQDSVDSTADPAHVLEKKSKSKKEKESTPKETKEKFSKEIFQDSVDSTADPAHVLEKKSKSKKEKESTPKETKEKSSKEIFQDSGDSTADPVHVLEKKSKSKKEKKSTPTETKEKSSKEIFKDSVDSTADPVHVLEKKSKSKKEKECTPKEIKEKFCDLFGDSNSLMTPEDLGIPSYLPISEDTQDAVDMKINQIIDATQLVDKVVMPGHILAPKAVEVTIQKTTAHDDIPTADLQKSITNIEAKEVIHVIENNISSKTNEGVIESNELPSPIVYENLNPGADLNDPNVVKTIIISSGIQPEIAFENEMQVTKPDTVVKVNTIENTKDINCLPATMEFKKDILKALATSTPHKEFSAMDPLETDAAKTDVICDPCVSQAVATITNVEPVVNQTENNTLESNDAPDIRIFVKRRRKVVKRPQMN